MRIEILHLDCRNIKNLNFLLDDSKRIMSSLKELHLYRSTDNPELLPCVDAIKGNCKIYAFYGFNDFPVE
jgi:hypothetical protein